MTSGPPATVRVLIADSDARVRHALRAVIDATPGLEVVGEASTPAQVLERDATLQPAVILLDFFAQCQEEDVTLLRTLVHQRGRPVVVLSIRGGLRAAALKAGARAFIEKGTPPEMVLAALRAVAEPEAGQMTDAQPNPLSQPS